MKIATEKFLNMLNEEGITCTVQNGHIIFSGGDLNLINNLHEQLDKNPEFEAAVIRHMNNQQGISLKEFMTNTGGAGVHIELVDTYTLKFTGGKDRTRKRLEGILERDNRLKNAVILSLAAKNSDALFTIQECACNRWADGYSDSLIMAILANLTRTGETIERDADGQIILKNKTDWNAEISHLFD